MIEIREITAEETRPLRQAILRPEKTVDQCVLPGDENPTSFHYGAFCDGQLATIATVLRQNESRFNHFAEDRSQFRLRGMATHEAFRGKGFAAGVLQKCIARSWEMGGDVFWCDARIAAAGFYEKMGFLSRPTEFEIPGVGPHLVMFVEARPD